MKKLSPGFKMKPDAVYFAPLGGCGHFGANMSLYGYNGKWIMVDCGMGFADDTMPGVEVILADPSFAVSLGDDLLGLVLTHGHADHIGGIEHIWPRFKCPIYATAFTATLVRQNLTEQSWGHQARVNEVAFDAVLTLGEFSIRFIHVAHSVPEAQALAITAGGAGTVLHTGDWKLDPQPVEGHRTDEDALRAIGDKGVLALVGDSTNAMVPGRSGSEEDVRGNMAELFSEFASGAIVVTCFSTNVARMRSIYEAAEKNNRQVCLVGRSLWRLNDAARATGYLADVPDFLDSDMANRLHVDNLVYICTGSQGEPRAALSRISNDEHPDVRLAEGDVVVFSSRAIPGNEKSIERIKNRLYAAGVAVITDRDAPIHVSGHPYRDELKQMYGWVRPKFSIPVHGEQMQMEKHAHLARECGVSDTLIPENGCVYEISTGGMRAVGVVDSGILAIEGKRIVPLDHEAILTRKRMMWNGSAVVTVVVDAVGALVAAPKITALGLLDETSDADADFIAGACRAIEERMRNLSKDDRRDDDALSEAVRVAARRYFQDQFDRKPQTRVHLVRI